MIAVCLQGLNLYLAFFGPDLQYEVEGEIGPASDDSHFSALIAFLTEAKILHGNQLEILTDGPCFYAAELAALRAARQSIHLEAYIFHRGTVSSDFVEVMAERARAGVKVRVTIDYIGSFSTPRSYFRKLLDAGGQVEWYHPLRPDLLLQINNRTHRELLIIDGATAFVGGAGIADWWQHDGVRGNRWRDMVVRIQGPSVTALQAVFAQNWLRVHGQILAETDFLLPFQADGAPALVVSSTPAAGATQARILFQLLISRARKCIYISSPYFLPDNSARRVIIKAVREHNVRVKILTPGDNNDERLTRASSRHLYGSLLKEGIEIYEYTPAMIHTKAMMIDDCWAVVGSTNFDYRSFAINDEVNFAILDPAVARRIIQDFERDLSQSKRITYEGWRQKWRFRLADRILSLLERQE